MEDITYSGGRRMVLFSTTAQLRRLARVSTFCMDGTFKITPKPWAQVAIISAELSTDVWTPIAFALLADKKYDTYLHLFNSLKSAVAKIKIGKKRGELAAQHFMADFETNIREAAKSTFSGKMNNYILYPISYIFITIIIYILYSTLFFS